MLKVERKATAILETMDAGLANGDKLVHTKAFAKWLALCGERFLVWRKLRKIQKFKCALCEKHGKHTHEVAEYNKTVEVNTYKELQTALDAEFAGVYRVSSPRFGKTVNVTAKDTAKADRIEVRHYILSVCGLELANEKTPKRKVLAVVKLP